MPTSRLLSLYQYVLCPLLFLFMITQDPLVSISLLLIFAIYCTLSAVFTLTLQILMMN